MIEGNTHGLQTSQRKALERTFRRKVAKNEVVSPELARHLTGLSRELGRQVGVLLNRAGVVKSVVVGDAHQLMLPDVGRLRGGAGRFRGLRLVHTHLRGEPLSADDLNDLALLRLDLVAVIQVMEDGGAGAIELAHLDPAGLVADDEGEETTVLQQVSQPPEPFQRIQARDIHALNFDFELTIGALEAEYTRLHGGSGGSGGKKEKERALVIGLDPEDEHFAETLELVRSSGVVIAGTLRQRRRKLHPKTVVGRGKLQELVLEGMRRRATVAIFDVDLKPAPARAFEDASGLKAIDRTQLILDIFAQRAKSRDGKLQVELAQLKYSLPRLTEKDAGLSRLTGGIGGRGPGETVMEIGRRRIRDRIRALEKQVEQLSKQRDLRRQRRRRAEIPVLSIIGYTNAGKSTLLNAMTKSKVEVEDKLFMTLDPTSRRLRFPREGEVIITDTVGFIADLPPDLIEAFRATLEELADADLLLHVVDAADDQLEAKVAAVEALLEDLKVEEVPQLMVLNKADLLSADEAKALELRYSGVAVSATRRVGLRRLVTAAEQALGDGRKLMGSETVYS